MRFALFTHLRLLNRFRTNLGNDDDVWHSSAIHLIAVSLSSNSTTKLHIPGHLMFLLLLLHIIVLSWTCSHPIAALPLSVLRRWLIYVGQGVSLLPENVH